MKYVKEHSEKEVATWKFCDSALYLSICYIFWGNVLQLKVLTLHKKKKFSIKAFFIKLQILSYLVTFQRKVQSWFHLLKKLLIENFVFVQCNLPIT